MKLSLFNYYVEHNKKTLVYNCLTRKYKIFNISLADLKLIIQELDQDSIKLLQKEYFITDKYSLKEEYDEYFKIREEKSKNLLYIVFTITTQCNLHCDYCFENQVKRIEMSNEIFYKFLEILEKRLQNDKTINEIFLVIFGGEPLLNKGKTLELLKNIQGLCKKYNLLFNNTLTTNGIIKDENYLKDLFYFGLKHIQITLDGSE